MLLKRLTEAMGPPGEEDEVRDILRSELNALSYTVSTDVMGNLYARREGSGPRVMLAAHMDEVCLMITRIDDAGLLRFRPMGGLDPRILVSKPVLIGRQRIPGVIGAKAIHLQSVDERKRVLGMDDLYIDIGALDAGDAKTHVRIGDCAFFATGFEMMGDGCVKAKSLDDRAGCGVLAEVAKRLDRGNTTFVWTVQEEIGLRGAGIAAERVAPDVAIVVEATICFDIAGAAPHESVTQMGKGPVISLIDRHTISRPEWVFFVVETAKRAGIPFQLRKTTSGGNDAGSIHLRNSGIPTVSISLPARYIHSPVQLMKQSDYEHTIELVAALVEAIGEGRFTR